MTMKNTNIDEAKIRDLCKETVQKLRTDSDIDTLTAIKKAFKKTVPFYLRNYVAAYFIDQILKGNGLQASQHSSRANATRSQKDYNGQREKPYNARYNTPAYSKSDDTKVQKSSYAPRDSYSQRSTSFETKSERTASFDAGGVRSIVEPSTRRGDAPYSSHAPFVPFTPAKIDDPKSIFINVGKNRHVFIQDILGLLEKVAQISKEQIGPIKIMSNYTFVELSDENVQKAISALNGYDYKHKPLLVNNARSRLERAHDYKDYQASYQTATRSPKAPATQESSSQEKATTQTENNLVQNSTAQNPPAQSSIEDKVPSLDDTPIAQKPAESLFATSADSTTPADSAQ